MFGRTAVSSYGTVSSSNQCVAEDEENEKDEQQNLLKW